MFWTGEQAVELGLADQVKATPLVINELMTEHGVTSYERYNGRRVNVFSMLTASLKDAVMSELKSTSTTTSFH